MEPSPSQGIRSTVRSGFWVTRILKGYCVLCCLILIGSAAVKLISVERSFSRVMEEHDPILHVSNRLLFAAVGSAEIVGAVVIFFLKPLTKRLLAIMLISGSFASYRIGLHSIGFTGFCPCMGDPTMWWPALAHALPAITNVLFGFLLLSWLLTLGLCFFKRRFEAVFS